MRNDWMFALLFFAVSSYFLRIAFISTPAVCELILKKNVFERNFSNDDSKSIYLFTLPFQFVTFYSLFILDIWFKSYIFD